VFFATKLDLDNYDLNPDMGMGQMVERRIRWKDAANKVLHWFVPDVARDEEGDEQLCRLRIQNHPSLGWLLFTALPLSWLKDSVGAVVIDPPTDYYGETVDGGITGNNPAYATARSTSALCSTSQVVEQIGQRFQTGYYYVHRCYFSFDTSAIGGDTVTAATLYVCSHSDISVTDFLIQVYRYAWVEDLCTNKEANYDGAYGSGTLEGTLQDTADGWVSGTYYNLAVSTAGIVKDGDSKYALVSQEDVDNSAPTGNEYVYARMADYADTASDPYLDITHSPGVVYKSVAGTLTSSGIVVKRTSVTRLGTLTSSGALIKKTLTTKTGTLTSSGALTTILTKIKVLAGNLTSSGAIVKKALIAKVGTLTSSGSLVKKTLVTRAGTLTSSGALAAIRTQFKALAGAISSSGNLVKKTLTTKVGTLTSSGSLVKKGFVALAGAVSSSGALVKKTIITRAGTLTSSGSLIKKRLLALAGTLTSSGSIATVYIQVKALAGTLTSSGAIVKKTLVTRVGNLASSGALAKKQFLALAGMLSLSGVLTAGKMFFRSLAGTLTSSGALTAIPTFVVGLTGTLTSSGNLVKKTLKQLAGGLSSTGSVVKKTVKSFVGSLTSTGAVQTAIMIKKALAGTLSSAGSLIAQIPGIAAARLRALLGVGE